MMTAVCKIHDNQITNLIHNLEGEEMFHATARSSEELTITVEEAIVQMK